MKKRITSILALAMAALWITGCGGGGESTSAETTKSDTAAEGTTAAANEKYPESDIACVVPFGDTSGTNTIWRAFVSAGLEAELGVSCIFDNQSGASGSVGTTYALNQPADGYTILMGSESTTMFKCLDLIDVTYDDMIPLCLVARDCGILCTSPGSKFEGMNFQDVIDYMLANPGEVTVGTTGVGTMPWVWWTLFENTYGVDITQVSFDGSGDANTALMGGHIDLFIPGITTSSALVEAGSLVPICVLDEEKLEGYDCDTIIDYNADFQQYLPYGSFFVASVKAGTPEDIVKKLQDTFMKVYDNEEFQSFLQTRGNIPMGLTGDDAQEFMKRQQAIISWLMYDLGESEIEPSEYGVERITE